MKSILIIGAGFLQSFVIKKANAMGYHTLTIDKNPMSIGFEFADEFKVIDIINKEACLDFALINKVDGVMTAATDYGVLTAAYIAKKMGLPGLDFEVSKVIKDKYLLRNTLYTKTYEGVSQFYEVKNLEDLSKIKNRIRFPVIVKPCDGSGSKAVARVDNLDRLGYSISKALKESLIKKVLIEEFIFGKEFGVESIVINNNVHVLGVMGKHMSSPPDYAELGHYMPSQLPIENKIKDVIQQSIEALGINFGAVNMDVLITNEEKVCIVDVGARMGGNLIGSHIIPIGTGIDYMEALLRSAVDDSVDLRPSTHGRNVSTRLLALKPGKVIKLPDFSDIEKHCNVRVLHHLKVGDTIHEYHNNLDGHGYVISIGKNFIETEKNVTEAKDLIDSGIVRE